MSEFPVHYRYSDCASKEGVKVKVSRFYPVRETPCFYIVIDEFEKHIQSVTKGRKPRTRRVSKDSLRRYCYPSKAEALRSYKKRKETQIRHCEYSLAIAKQALYGLDKLKDNTDDVIKIGRPDYFDGLVFD